MMAWRLRPVNPRQIARIFLTHLHDDHTADLAVLLNRQWTDGRVDPVTVVGPFGTKRIVEAAVVFGEANAAVRLADEARSVKPADMFRGQDISATAMPLLVYQDERVVVRSVEKTHYPLESKRKMPYRSVSFVLSHVIPGALDPPPNDTYLAPARKTSTVRWWSGATSSPCRQG